MRGVLGHPRVALLLLNGRRAQVAVLTIGLGASFSPAMISSGPRAASRRRPSGLGQQERHGDVAGGYSSRGTGTASRTARRGPYRPHSSRRRGLINVSITARAAMGGMRQRAGSSRHSAPGRRGRPGTPPGVMGMLATSTLSSTVAKSCATVSPAGKRVLDVDRRGRRHSISCDRWSGDLLDGLRPPAARTARASRPSTVTGPASRTGGTRAPRATRGLRRTPPARRRSQSSTGVLRRGRA